MTTFSYFTVTADFVSVVQDSIDAGVDPVTVAGTGKVTFTPMVATGDGLTLTTLSPRSALGKIGSFSGSFDTDGQLKYKGAVGVRLVADTSVLGLSSHLFYTVTFSGLKVNGQAVTLESFNFQAAQSDTPISLVSVARVPGQPASGITNNLIPDHVRRSGNNAIFSANGVDLPSPIDISTLTVTSSEISDATTVGKELLTASSAESVLSILGLPVFPVGNYANLQAAINACNAAGGGVVQLPAGATPVGAQVEMLSKVVVQGPPSEWSVWGYNTTPTNYQVAWLAPDTSTTNAVINFANTVVDAGIRDLMIKGVPTRNGITLSDNTVRGGNRLRNVYVNGANVGIVAGQLEVRMRDILVMECASDGVQINQQDCEWEGGVVGYNGGNGVVIADAAGPIRLDTLDTFFNTGHGLIIDGFGHRMNGVIANNNNKNGVLFRTATATTIINIYAAANGQEYTGSGGHTTRYSDVLFAHPTAGNLGCALIGGTVYLPDGSGAPTKHAVESTEVATDLPAMIGVKFGGTYSTGASPFDLLSPLSNFRINECTGVPNITRQQAGLPPMYASFGAVDQVQFRNAGFTAVSGVREEGAFYTPVAATTASSASGAPSLDMHLANEWDIALDANVTSTTVTDLQAGQWLTIRYTQDATGSRTYAWPSNCRFAGPSKTTPPTATTTPLYSDSVTFTCDGTLLTEIGRAIGSVPVFDPSSATHAASSKTTPVDADELPIADSAASFGLKKLTWANLKATLAAWLTTLTATWSNKTLTGPKIDTIYDTGGNAVATINSFGSPPVNGFTFTGTPTGVAAFLQASGSDTNIGLNFVPKGTGAVGIYENAGQTSATLFAAGSATNVDLNLNTQGTGVAKTNGNPVSSVVGVPGSHSATGLVGQSAGDGTAFYFCYAANSWGKITWTSTSF